MPTPRFTIILPSYNGGSYLRSAVASVLQQSYKNFELAVLEDGSTDGSLEWLRSLNDPRLKIYSLPENIGITKNWQRASEIPRGEFMTFFGQDDLLDTNYLEVLDSLIKQEPDASLYFAHFRHIDKDNEVIRHCRPLPARETAAEYIASLFTGVRDTGNSGYMMRSALYDEVGGIPSHPKLLFADDALWIKLMRSSWKATATEECISCRLHTASTGATGGVSWIEGMREYVSFLNQLSQHDPKIAHTYNTYGPDYFYAICRDTYIHGLNNATRNNRGIDQQFKNEIFTQLSRVSSERANALRHDRKVLLYKTINMNPILRWTCARYLARYR